MTIRFTTRYSRT